MRYTWSDRRLHGVAELGRPIVHDVANTVQMAQFDGDGRVRRYARAGLWSVLAEGTHATAWAVDGQLPPPHLPARVRLGGRRLDRECEWEGLRLTVSLWLDDASPWVYKRYRLEPISGGSGHHTPRRVYLADDLDVAASPFVFWAVTTAPLRLAGAGAPRCTLVDQAGMHGLRLQLGSAFDLWWAWDRPVHAEAEEMKLRAAAEVDVGTEPVEVTWILGATDPELAPFFPGPAEALAGAGAAGESARAHSDWVGSRFQCGDPLLESLAAAGIETALASYKEVPPAGFRGFFAGVNYQSPLRTYYRDGYWTVQAALPFRPDWVRGQVVTLAAGVHDDGQAPSAVLAQTMEGVTASTIQGRDFWPDHCDAPSFFVLLLYDYLCWTGDVPVLDEDAAGLSVLERARRALDYLARLDQDGDGLFEKPYGRRDWADNVYRSGWVAYDLALHHGALLALARILEHGPVSAPQGAEEAARYRQRARRLREAFNAKLWLDEAGHYLEFKDPARGVEERHLALDTLLALRLGVAPPDRAARVLEATRRLQSRHNPHQPWGDWGVLACDPPYAHPELLVEKSRDPFRYHNGADWPYLDGVYGALLLERRDPDWRHVLTRWWAYGLEQGWTTPVEYQSPGYPPGSFLQGWSSFPAAVLMQEGFGLKPDLDGHVALRVPPWGPSRLRGILLRGQRWDVVCDGRTTVLVPSKDTEAAGVSG